MILISLVVINFCIALKCEVDEAGGFQCDEYEKSDLETPLVKAYEHLLGIFGDQTSALGDYPGVVDYSYLKKAAEFYENMGIENVLHVGDVIESLNEIDQKNSDFSEFVNILEKEFNFERWVISAGDHDVNPLFDQDSSNRSNEEFFFNLLQEFHYPYLSQSGALYHHVYLSPHLDVISLYALEHLCTDPRWGNVFLNGIGDEQFQWLKGLLSRLQKDVILLVHQPLWYNWMKWSRIHNILASHGRVRAVIAGHFHYPSDEDEIDGIKYVVVGATGANLMKKTNIVVNVATVLRITDQEIEFEMFDIDDNFSSIPFQKRVTMSRLNTLSYYSTYGIGRDNQFYKGEDGKIYECSLDCLDDNVKKKEAKLRIVELGNPIDVPIEVSLIFDGPTKQNLLNPHWIIQLQKDLVNTSFFQATLPPNFNTGISNEDLAESSSGRNAIWESGITKNVEKIVLEKVEYRFVSEGVEVWMEIVGQIITVHPEESDCPKPRCIWDPFHMV